MDKENAAKNTVQVVTDYVNSFNHSDEEFAKLMCREHRTLQQSVMRLFISFVREEAKLENYDARNEASVMLSKKIVDLIDKEGVTLPMI